MDRHRLCIMLFDEVRHFLKGKMGHIDSKAEYIFIYNM